MHINFPVITFNIWVSPRLSYSLSGSPGAKGMMSSVSLLDNLEVVLVTFI